MVLGRRRRHPLEASRHRSRGAQHLLVCLRPEVADYRPDVGLRLGRVGFHVSPAREEPRRPATRPSGPRPWTDHARNVAREPLAVGARPSRPCPRPRAGAPIRASSASIKEAVGACALLHDLGKLQAAWQAWAEAAQRDVIPPTARGSTGAHRFRRGQSQPSARRSSPSRSRPGQRLTTPASFLAVPVPRPPGSRTRGIRVSGRHLVPSWRMVASGREVRTAGTCDGWDGASGSHRTCRRRPLVPRVCAGSTWNRRCHPPPTGLFATW